MRNRLIVIAVSGAMLCHSPAAQAQSCLGADALSTFMINAAKNLMTSAVADVVKERQVLQIPVVSPDSITLVTDTTVCSQMSAAYANASGSVDARPGHVHVVKVGSIYLVLDPAIKKGEYLVEMVISPAGVVLAKYLT